VTGADRGAQPYYVNTQMRMKNPWGGGLNLGHWGGGEIGKLFFTSNCTNSSRKKRLIRVLKFVSKIRYNSPPSICNCQNFSGGDTPVKRGKGRDWRGEGEEGRERGMGGMRIATKGGWTPLGAEHMTLSTWHLGIGLIVGLLSST
jgi:hypothetical protein